MTHVLRTAKDLKTLGTILSIWAHPDDETFMAAGIMATAVDQGQRVVCVTATRGEGGVQDENRWPANKLGQIRTQELKKALRILGVSESYILDYPDGGCSAVSISEAASRVLDIINKVKPDTILTFGPEGWSGHSDHMTVSKWVTAAAKQSPKTITVYHVTQSKEGYEGYLKQIDAKFHWFYETPSNLKPAEACDCCFYLSPKTQDLKYKALAAMPSQYAKAFELFDRQFICKALATETFTKAK